jgi:hypothetical protein
MSFGSGREGFGRNRQAKEKTTADPYGMTRRKATARARTTADPLRG